MNPDKIFNSKQIIVCCGSGGVGKTTTAAAVALEAASRGKKAIVLTIDPAKRLATAMGVDALSNEPREISLPVTSPSLPRARLFAMMLDTKRTFDRLIEKYASSPQAREAILNNQLYQHMSNMIAGSQEYMAMEKLYEIYQEGDFDLLVLDTPPTRHALDFLEAPQRMVNITENSLLKWFLKPGFFAGTGLRVLGRGAEKILSVFDRLAGFGFLHELSEMVSLISSLLGGFHDRARSVYELLRKNFVGFLLVTSPSSVSIQDALYFHQKIKEYGLPFMGFVINRIHEPGGPLKEEELTLLSPSLREKVLQQLRNYEQLALRDQRAIALLKKMGGKNVLYASVPLFGADVHDLDGLVRLNKALFA